MTYLVGKADAVRRAAALVVEGKVQRQLRPLHFNKVEPLSRDLHATEELDELDHQSQRRWKTPVA
jgi:hypothetical protein